MTIAELRHSAWNYRQLAASAERNAAYAHSLDEQNTWENVLDHMDHVASELERLADRLEEYAGILLPLTIVAAGCDRRMG